MCGIAFAWGANAFTVTEDMVRRSHHRGPDGSGVLQCGSWALGNARLAIIDLPGGVQPMQTADQRLTLVFNGEIYNYGDVRDALIARGAVLRSRSDTEVILEGFRLLGDEIFELLRGMWAVAIHDAHTDEVTVSRDPVGEKQLFYALDGGRLLAASELPVLLGSVLNSRVLAASSVPHFLARGYVPSGQPILEGVNEVPSGTTVRFRQGHVVATRTYWDPYQVWRASRDTATLDEVGAALERAVERSLVSDVPMSIMLSAGIDSSLVAAMAASKGPCDGLAAYSLQLADQRYDEAAEARRLASDLGIPFKTVDLSGADAASLFPDIIRHNALQANPAQFVFYALAQAMKDDGRKVTLNGSGGDELFAGYPTYRASRAFSIYRHVPARVRGRLAAWMESGGSSSGRLPRRFVARQFTRYQGRSIDEAHASWRAVITAADYAALAAAHDPKTFDPVLPDYSSCTTPPPEHDRFVIQRLLIADLLSWLRPMFPWVDNATMANSVELRQPFLDRDLIDTAYALPSRVLFSGWSLKRVLKTLSAASLPPRILNRPKTGTHIPLAEWIRGPLQPQVTSAVTALLETPGSPFDPRAVEGMVKDHMNGVSDHRWVVWHLAVLGAWMDAHRVTFA